MYLQALAKSQAKNKNNATLNTQMAPIESYTIHIQEFNIKIGI
jgi:hypothetical protein